METKIKTHYSIEPIDIIIDEKVFTESKLSNTIRGKIIALDIYPNEAITFTILLDNGTIYNYVPVHLVQWKNTVNTEVYNLNELVYNNSLSNEVTIDVFNHLKDLKCNCYIKQKDSWVTGEYILSIDWYKDNDLLNFIKLENGQFAFLPNHKILFGDVKREFQPYKKARWECVI